MKIYISGVLIDYLLKEYRANKLKEVKQLLDCMVFVHCSVKRNSRVLAHSLVSNIQTCRFSSSRGQGRSYPYARYARAFLKKPRVKKIK